MYAHIIDKQRFYHHKLERYMTIYTYMYKFMYWKERYTQMPKNLFSKYKGSTNDKVFVKYLIISLTTGHGEFPIQDSNS